MRRHFLPTLSLLFLSFLVSLSALAEEIDTNSAPPIDPNTQPMKVLGRGMESNLSDDGLQLACVGEPVSPDALERKCDRLQFLLREKSGLSLIGPVLNLEGAKNLRKQLQSELDRFHLLKDTAHRTKFIATRAFYSGLLFKKRDNPYRSASTAELVTFGVTAALAGNLTVIQTLAAGATVAGAAQLGLFIAAGMLAPLTFDILSLPITILIDKRKSKKKFLLQGFSGKDVAKLQDRSVPAFSLNPKRVDGHRFSNIVNHIRNTRSTASTEIAPTNEDLVSNDISPVAEEVENSTTQSTSTEEITAAIQDAAVILNEMNFGELNSAQ